MKPQLALRITVTIVLSVLIMAPLWGCATRQHKTRPWFVSHRHALAGTQTECAAAATVAGQEHMHIYLVNGIDFYGYSNLKGLADYLKSLGYRHTQFGQLYHSGEFLNRICMVCREDAQAKIVLVGFSAGAYCVRDLAADLNERGIRVALLVYLAGDLLKNDHAVRPPNVDRVLNVYGDGFLFSGRNLIFRTPEIDGARNICLKTNHLAVPSHKDAVASLAEELGAVAHGEFSRTHP